MTFSLRRHLVAKGEVEVPNGSAACAAGVLVKIQRRGSGRWVAVESTWTSFEGRYRVRLRDQGGKYRALAPAVQVPIHGGTVDCLGTISVVRRHRH